MSESVLGQTLYSQHVYKGHLKECSLWVVALYIQVKINGGEIRLPFIDIDVLYRDAP